MEIEKEKLEEMIDAVQKAYLTGKVEVNDGDNGDGNKEYEITNDKNKGMGIAHLVLEEDDSVRWYFNPNEHSDLVIAVIPVITKI